MSLKMAARSCMNKFTFKKRNRATSAAKNMKTGTAVGLQGNADSKFDGVATSLPKTAKPFYGGRISRKRHKTKRKRRKKKRATRKRRRSSKHRRRSRRRRN